MEPFLCGLVLALFLHEINGSPSYGRETIAPDGPVKDNSTSGDGNYDIPFGVRNITNMTITTDETEPDYDDTMISLEDDYEFSLDYYDSFGICTDKSSVIIASDIVGVLSSSTKASSEDPEWTHWTVAPKHYGGSVTIIKKDNSISPKLFQGGCEDLHVFQSWRNRTNVRMNWCHETRLLPCDAMMQISYHILGYKPTTESGRAVDIVQLASPPTYDYAESDDEAEEFSLYYYECGGLRYRGDIRSPLFPDEEVPYRGRVTCKWDLRVSHIADYGILRFSGFSLPSCENHYLTIEEDTVIDEEDVTESLLKMLGEETKLGDSNAEIPVDYPGGMRSSELNSSKNATQDAKFRKTVGEEQDQRGSLYFYRDGSISKSEVESNPRIGIHAVVFKKYCGDFKPKRTFTWRRGSKNVSLTFFSDNYTLRDYGFTAKFSTFSFLNTMKRHWKDNGDSLEPESKSDVPHMIFNYIILIIFVPIGLTVGLSLIIFHMKRRGPILKDFYRRDRKDSKFRRSHFDRAKPISPRVRGPARRVRSLKVLGKNSKQEVCETGLPAKTSEKRRNSMLGGRLSNMKNKRSSPLKTLVEEDSTSSIKMNRTTTPVPKIRIVIGSTS